MLILFHSDQGGDGQRRPQEELHTSNLIFMLNLHIVGLLKWSSQLGCAGIPSISLFPDRIPTYHPSLELSKIIFLV